MMSLAVGEIVGLVVFGIGTVLWLAALVDCAVNAPLARTPKTLALVAIAVTYVLGGLVYWIARAAVPGLHARRPA